MKRQSRIMQMQQTMGRIVAAAVVALVVGTETLGSTAVEEQPSATMEVTRVDQLENGIGTTATEATRTARAVHSSSNNGPFSGIG